MTQDQNDPRRLTTLRPTATAGAILAIVLGALPAAGLGLDVAWVVVAAGVSVLMLSPWLARRQVLAIRDLSRDAHVFVSEGRTSWTQLGFDCKRGARDLLLAITVPTASPVEQERAPRIAVLAVGPGSEVSFACPLRIGQRGRYAGLTALAESSFPFGLFVATHMISLPGDVTVYPRVFDRRDRRLDPWLQGLALGLDEPRKGRPTARSPGLPMTVRSARSGDTARDLAWRHSARRLRWLAFDRAPTTRGRVEITLLLAVHDSGPRGTRAYPADARGRSSAGRRELAFEWAVRATATLVVQLLSSGHDVTTNTVDSSEDGSLDRTLSRAPIDCVASHRASAHLELLTDVQMQVGYSVAGEPSSPARPSIGAGWRSGDCATVVVIPIVRTAMPEELADTRGGRGSTERRASTGRRGPTGRGGATTTAIGVDAVGRLIPLEIRSSSPASRVSQERRRTMEPVRDRATESVATTVRPQENER